jgi:hypothetical protein
MIKSELNNEWQGFSQTNLRSTKETVAGTLIAPGECASSTAAMSNTKSSSTLCVFGTPLSFANTITAVL